MLSNSQSFNALKSMSSIDLPTSKSLLPTLQHQTPLLRLCGESKMLGSLRINGGRQRCRGIYFTSFLHFKASCTDDFKDIPLNVIQLSKNRELHTMFLGLLLGASYKMSLVFTYLYTTNKQRS